MAQQLTEVEYARARSRLFWKLKGAGLCCFLLSAPLLAAQQHKEGIFAGLLLWLGMGFVVLGAILMILRPAYRWEITDTKSDKS